MSERHDVVVIGGGIVGLATAYRLLRSRPGLRLAVLEKEPELALHQTGRNSGVIHAGLYYTPGSLKARLCREGKDALEAFCTEHDVPFERCGKLVVAVDETELPRLAELKARGEANGLRGLEGVGPERIAEIEPHAAGIRALHVAETCIVDFRRVALAYAEEVRTRGGEILLGRRLTDIRRYGDELVVETPQGDVLAWNLITCAGLQSDRVATMTGAPRRCASSRSAVTTARSARTRASSYEGSSTRSRTPRSRSSACTSRGGSTARCGRARTPCSRSRASATGGSR